MKSWICTVLLLFVSACGSQAEPTSVKNSSPTGGKADGPSVTCDGGASAICEILPAPCPAGEVLVTDADGFCFECVDESVCVDDSCDPLEDKSCGDDSFCISDSADEAGACSDDFRAGGLGLGYRCGGGIGAFCADGLTCEIDPNGPVGSTNVCVSDEEPAVTCDGGASAICEIVPPQCLTGEVLVTDAEGFCFECVAEDVCADDSCDPLENKSCGDDSFCISDSADELGECSDDFLAGGLGLGYRCGGGIGAFCADGLVCDVDPNGPVGSTSVCTLP